ncbi:tetratricopeptide repeat protein [Candidatus Eisenbacteria bacterium]|uniref:Tetratricopeptide repeat protein n=1 Tax=Eiseniibacteriota bacterium TaxID=2212470 RepID=A0ABV6YP93_UNCEI
MTSKDEKFNFQYEKFPVGDSMRAVTAEEAEAWLLEQFDKSGGKDVGVLEELLLLYLRTRETSKSIAIADQLGKLIDGDGKRSYLLFRYGQIAEQMGDYTAAENLYRNSLSLKPPAADTEYWVNNNLGFCLNTLGRFGEAEEYLKAAIDIYSDRSNAFKNLGLCYRGQERFAEAAEMFVAATRANAADARSLAHLEELIEATPELLESVPGISESLENCRAAVKKARAMAPDFEAYWKALREKHGEEASGEEKNSG